MLYFTRETDRIKEVNTMSRRNRPRHNCRSIISQRYDSDVCFLPGMPGVKRIIAHPVKTIYRNIDAAPWAWEERIIRNPDDGLLREIEEGRRRA